MFHKTKFIVKLITFIIKKPKIKHELTNYNHFKNPALAILEPLFERVQLIKE